MVLRNVPFLIYCYTCPFPVRHRGTLSATKKCETRFCVTITAYTEPHNSPRTKEIFSANSFKVVKKFHRLRNNFLRRFILNES